MRLFHTIGCLLLGVSQAATATAQATVVSTRTYNNERFDLTKVSSGFIGGNMLFFAGLDEEALTSNGTPLLVEIDIDVQWDIDLDITNQLSVPVPFVYSTVVSMLPQAGDCVSYTDRNLFESTGTVDPGGVGSLQINELQNFEWSGSSFSPSCGTNQWNWQGLHFQTNIDGGVLTINQDGTVPQSWIQINQAAGTFSGEMRITWIPDPLPFQSICAGTASPHVSLAPFGGVDETPNVYLIQEGAPQSVNLIVEADQASSIILPSGLCVGGNVRRIPESLSVGGPPFRLPEPDRLLGTTTYFQSWFRTGSTGSATSECIEVSFP